eukprot:6282747-Alexandrium_andersonii.AAC.1
MRARCSVWSWTSTQQSLLSKSGCAFAGTSGAGAELARSGLRQAVDSYGLRSGHAVLAFPRAVGDAR